MDGLTDNAGGTIRSVINVTGTCQELTVNNVTASASALNGNCLIDCYSGCAIGTLLVNNASTANIGFWMGTEVGTETVGTVTFANCTGTNAKCLLIWNQNGSTIGTLNLQNDTMGSFTGIGFADRRVRRSVDYALTR